MKETFICCECSSKKCHEHYEVEPSMTRSPAPMRAILHIHVCADCGYHIPSHLALRWRRMSFAAAKREWETVDRQYARRERRRAGFPNGLIG